MAEMPSDLLPPQVDEAKLQAVMTEAQRIAMNQMAQRCRVDLFYLCKYILGYDLMTQDTHGDLCIYVQSLLDEKVAAPVIERDADKVEGGHNFSDQFDPRKNFLLLLMPRGSFKSSVVTIGFTLQLILSDPDCRVLIDSETFSKSKAFLSEIKGHLQENEKYRAIYYHIYGSYPDDKKRDDIWTDSQVNISARKRQRKEPTISCAGIDVTKTGMHYDLIIADDLMSEKNITTREQIDQVINHYKLALSLLDPGKPFIVIGTRWDYKDVYQHILDNEMDRFNILVRRAHNDDGSLFFPERLTESFLQATKRSQGSYIYSCQYENNPVDNETATFKRSTLRRIEWDLVKDKPMNWYMSIDPSWEGPYSDFVGAILAGIDINRDIYVRECMRAKMTYAGIINLIFDWHKLYNPRQIIIETIAQQKSLQYMLNDEQKRRGSWLPITEIKARTQKKEERIRGLAPYYEFGHIYHVKESNYLDDLEDELIHFPKGTHDDMIDALATVLEVAAPPSRAQQRSEDYDMRRKRLRSLDKPRSPVTGY